jgi:putative superfamily III holin-X
VNAREMRNGVGADDRSLGDLLKDLTGEFQHLARAEVELAKLEIREELVDAKDAASKFGLAAGAGVLAVLMISFAAAWGLAEVMPAGVAFLIIGVVYGAVAWWAFARAREQAKHVDPVPEQTIQTLKEDVQWARARSN